MFVRWQLFRGYISANLLKKNARTRLVELLINGKSTLHCLKLCDGGPLKSVAAQLHYVPPTLPRSEIYE